MCLTVFSVAMLWPQGRPLYKIEIRNDSIIKIESLQQSSSGSIEQSTVNQYDPSVMEEMEKLHQMQQQPIDVTIDEANVKPRGKQFSDTDIELTDEQWREQQLRKLKFDQDEEEVPWTPGLRNLDHEPEVQLMSQHDIEPNLGAFENDVVYNEDYLINLGLRWDHPLNEQQELRTQQKPSEDRSDTDVLHVIPFVPPVMPNETAGSPDLDVLYISVADFVGPVISYTYKIENEGSASTISSFKNAIYLSTNTTITTIDYKVATHSHYELLAAGASYVSTTLTATVTGVPSGSYYLGIIADSENSIPEDDEGNNTAYDLTPKVAIVNTGTADLDVLTVSAIDAVGPTISYNYSIKNNGTASVSGVFYNGIYLSTNTLITNADYKIDQYPHSEAVPAGGSYTSATLSTTISGIPSGSYYLGVMTDIYDVVSETNESNNTGYDLSPKVSYTNTGYPDLDVTTVSVLDGVGPIISYRYYIKNQGTASVLAPFHNALFLSTNTTITDNDYRFKVATHTEPIAAGATYASAILSTYLSGIPDGDYYLGVITDYYDVIRESNESNNTGYDASPKVTPNASASPDLDVLSVVVYDYTGPAITYRYSIENEGTATISTNFKNAMYLSANTYISVADYKISEHVHNEDIVSGASYTSALLSTTISGVPEGYYYLGMIADSDDDISESDESNNTGYDVSPKVYTPNTQQPDLDITAVNVTVSTCPAISYNYTIKNIGEGTVSATFRNDIYLSANTYISPADVKIYSILHTGDLAPSQSYTSTTLSTSVVGVDNGTYYLGVITDAENVVAEKSESNKTGYDASPTITIDASCTDKPDLDVLTVTVSDYEGPDITYQYSIKNNGPGDVTTAFKNGIYLSTNTTITVIDYKIKEWDHFSSLLSGASYTSASLTTTLTGIPAGSYYLGVITDLDNALNEVSESNNTGYAVSPKVLPGGVDKPDLDVTAVNVTNAVGPTVQFNYEITNIGAADFSTTFSNAAYLSLNTSISAASDVKIGEYNHVGGVPHGDSYTSATLSANISAVADGSYYLGIITDANNVIDEENEANNTGYCASPKIEVETPPDHNLSISSVSVSNASGPDITYSFTVANTGADNIATSFTNGVYLSLDTDITTGDYKIDEHTEASGLNAASSLVHSNVNTTVTGVPAGSYYLGIIADVENSVSESNETNNTAYSADMVSMPVEGKPDLETIGAVISDYQDLELSYIYVLQNKGLVNISSLFKAGVYLSTDATITVADKRIDSFDHASGLGAGGVYSSALLSTTLVDVESGDYYLGIIADYEDAIDEEDETNNSIASVNQIDVSIISFAMQEDVSGQLYPNPANEVIYAKGFVIGSQFELYSLTGQLVKQVIVDSDDFVLDVSDMVPGVYIVKAMIESGNLVKKIVIDQ